MEITTTTCLYGLASAHTCVCCAFGVFFFLFFSDSTKKTRCDRAEGKVETRPELNCSGGGGGTSGEETFEIAQAVLERQPGASMMEQLELEVTTHALSYMDYPSLCRLSLTNSLMRKGANDDNAWRLESSLS